MSRTRAQLKDVLSAPAKATSPSQHALPDHLVRRMHATGWALRRNYSDLVSLDWRTAFAADLGHFPSVRPACRACT
ncbi:hypothetical protein ACH4OT_13595 [Streptomyces murinus]|uniref:hypothetical protein n=1 Tax=Streptomyces murinus TaxID=33900 RepID=UPI0037B8C787